MISHKNILMATAAILLTLSAFPTVLASTSKTSNGFNQPGNILITDQFNNRIIEVNPATNQIVWSFGSGNGLLCNPGPHSIIGSNDAERLSGGLTLMVGTGIPAGVPGTTPCVDNRVIVVNQQGEIVWQYGVAGKTGSGHNRLSTPVFAIETPNHDIMIVDQGNNRVIEVTQDKQIVFSYGNVNNPNSAEVLPNNNVLIADENNNRVIEIDRAGNIVWQYSAGINFAAFASRLPNGDTLITDSGNARIVEVTGGTNPTIVSQYFTNADLSSNSSPLPTNAVRLANGNTIIADQFNDRALIVGPAPAFNFVYQYGAENTPGNGFDQTYGPYTAYVIGDYIGQTPPPPTF